MKVAFFQPYMAAWRIEFLERYVRTSHNRAVVYDGGFRPKRDEKSVGGNTSSIDVKRLRSFSPILRFKAQEYPVYFSPFLFFHLIKDRPEAVVTEGEINFLNNFSVWLYSRIFRASFIWWSLGKVRTRRRNALNRILDPVIDFLLARADAIVARNGYAKAYYAEHKGISPDRIFLAPNSMDEERARAEIDEKLDALLDERADRKVVLYVGALTVNKRPEDLVRVLKLFVGQGRTDILFWFVGDGPLRADLETACQEEIGMGLCRFWGKHVRGAGNFFAASDVVVVPGLGGLVINHAMIFGKPVISRVADGTEMDLIESGRNGYILESYSDDELAEAILAVIDAPDYSEMCARSLQMVETKWNMGQMISGMDQAIAFAARKKVNN